MRVTLVVPTFAPRMGGVETHAAALATGLAERGCHVEVVTQDVDRSLPQLERMPGGFDVRRFPAWPRSRHYQASLGLARYVHRLGKNTEVVHAHNYHTLAALFGTTAASVPVVVTPHYHGGSSSRFRNLLHRPYRPIGAWLLSRAARVICVSHQEAALLGRHFPWLGAKVSVVPNGARVRVGLRACYRGASASGGQPEPASSPPAGRRVLSVGRLDEYKQVDRVVSAMSHLPPEVSLTVAGDGPARPSLEALVRSAGLQERVRLVGTVADSELERLFAEADAFATLSTHEASGLTLLDALGSGLPCVVSDIPAHLETASHAPGRCLAVAKDAEAATVAAALSQALALPIAAPTSLPTWDEVAAATIEVYAQALGARAA